MKAVLCTIQEELRICRQVLTGYPDLFYITSICNIFYLHLFTRDKNV